MRLWSSLYGQFRQPHGFLGHVAGLIMSSRASNKKRNAWTVDVLDVKDTDEILEFGCGPGLALAQCALQLKGGHLVAIDHSKLMLKYSKARLARLALKDVTVDFREGGLEQLEQFEARFDKIYAINVIQFFEDKQSALGAFKGALKPGGRLVITYMPRNRNATPKDAKAMSDQLVERMTSAGFEDIQALKLPLNPIPAICVAGRCP